MCVCGVECTTPLAAPFAPAFSLARLNTRRAGKTGAGGGAATRCKARERVFFLHTRRKSRPSASLQRAFGLPLFIAASTLPLPPSPDDSFHVSHPPSAPFFFAVSKWFSFWSGSLFFPANTPFSLSLYTHPDLFPPRGWGAARSRVHALPCLSLSLAPLSLSFDPTHHAHLLKPFPPARGRPRAPRHATCM